MRSTLFFNLDEVLPGGFASLVAFDHCQFFGHSESSEKITKGVGWQSLDTHHAAIFLKAFPQVATVSRSGVRASRAS